MPTVAIAGSGDTSVYLVEELLRAGFAVTVLTRSTKERLSAIPGAVQKVVDFASKPRLVDAIGEAAALISTILDYTDAFTEVNLALIEACKASPHCRRFIPSEFVGDVRAYPEQPPFYVNRAPVRAALRGQDQLEFTIICLGWLMDYIIPRKNRHMSDIGDAFPVNLADGRFVIPGAGEDEIEVTATRDLARAVVHLLQAPRGSWEEYIYVSGEKTLISSLVERVRERYGLGRDSVRHVSLEQLAEAYAAAKSDKERRLAEMQLFTVSGAASFDSSKVEAHREKYFKGMHFRTVGEVFEALDKDGDLIV